MFEINKIYCMDALEGLKQLEDNSIDLIITDPPYGSGGRDGSVHLNNPNICGNKMSNDSYIWMVKQYSKELYRSTKLNSHCYVFSDWRKFMNVKIAFEISSWELRSLIVWNKKNGMGEFWRSCHEFILFFTKFKPRKLNHGKCFNVLEFNPVRSNKLHPMEKPINLIQFLIKASSNINDIIFDPFVGSGTTAVACKQLHRNFIGFEINPEYVDIANKRLSKVQMAMFN